MDSSLHLFDSEEIRLNERARSREEKSVHRIEDQERKKSQKWLVFSAPIVLGMLYIVYDFGLLGLLKEELKRELAPKTQATVTAQELAQRNPLESQSDTRPTPEPVPQPEQKTVPVETSKVIETSKAVATTTESAPIPSTPSVKAAAPVRAAVGPIVGQCDGYLIPVNDTLSEIAQREYGNWRLYTEIAKANNIANPNIIWAGDCLVIPSLLHTQAESATTVISSLPSSIEGLVEEVIQVPVIEESIEPVIETTETESTTVTNEAVIDEPVVEETTEAAMTETVIENKIETPEVDAEIMKNGILKKGRYEISVPRGVFDEGVFPAIVLLKKGDDGQWILDKTQVVVRNRGDDDELVIPLKRDADFGDDSALVFDLGGEKKISVQYRELFENRAGPIEDLGEQPERETYGELFKSFPGKVRPSRWSRFFRTTLKVARYGISEYAAYASVGPWGLAIPPAQMFIHHKAEKAQNRALEIIRQAQ